MELEKLENELEKAISKFNSLNLSTEHKLKLRAESDYFFEFNEVGDIKVNYFSISITKDPKAKLKFFLNLVNKANRIALSSY